MSTEEDRRWDMERDRALPPEPCTTERRVLISITLPDGSFGSPDPEDAVEKFIEEVGAACGVTISNLDELSSADFDIEQVYPGQWYDPNLSQAAVDVLAECYSEVMLTNGNSQETATVEDYRADIARRFTHKEGV